MYVEQITASSVPLHALVTFPPVKKTLVLVVNEAERTTELVWTDLEKKILLLPGFEPRPSNLYFLVYLPCQ